MQRNCSNLFPMMYKLWRLHSVPNVIRQYQYQLLHQSTYYMNKSVSVLELPKDSSAEILQIASKNAKSLSSEQTITALRTLFELQKNSGTSVDLSNILQNSHFERLCQALKWNARTMDLNDVIDALKIITFFGVSPSSQITMSLLHLIKIQINDVSIGHIIFLEFLLRRIRIKSNPLIDALHMALPMLLQIQIGTKLDHENKTQLTELLHFVSRYRVSEQCTMNIINALAMHGHDLNHQQARSVIWSMCDPNFRFQNINCKKLLHNCIRLMKRDFDNEEKFDTVLITLEKMTDKYLLRSTQFCKEFYDEALYNKFAEFVVKNDLGFAKATYIQRHLNKLHFSNINLVKYMLNEVMKDHRHIITAKTSSLLSLISALSKANYKPENWNEIYPLILQSDLIVNGPQNVHLPWMKLSTELLSLGVECPTLYDKIFSTDFLERYLKKDKDSTLVQLLNLYKHLKVLTTYTGKIDSKYLDDAKKLVFLKEKYPIRNYVESAFGGSPFVYTKVRTDMGDIIDHLIVFDKHTQPVRIPDDQSNYDVHYNDLNFNHSSKKWVAIMYFSQYYYCINTQNLQGVHELKLRNFERMGMPVTVINQHAWTSFPEAEKVLFIKKKVELKL